MQTHKGSMPFNPHYGQVGVLETDHLVNGNKVPVLIQSVEVAPDKGILKRGSVVSLKSGKLVLCAKTITEDTTDDSVENPTTTNITDGSQNPYGILAEDVDTGATEKRSGQVFLTGEFDTDSLIFGEGYQKEDMPALLRGLGIFVSDSIQMMY